jgi:DNA-binding IclR family transcriptional regulator
MTDKDQSTGTLQTVSRAVAVLRCFEGGSKILSLAELTRLMGLNKVTVFRLASTLVHEGLLKQDPATAAFSVSYGLISLGRALLDPEGLTSLARPALLKARNITGETINLNVREGWESVIVEAVHSKMPIRFVLEAGSRFTLNLGAASLAILSSMPELEIDKMLSEQRMDVPAGSESVDVKVLRKRIRAVQKQGFANTKGERFKGAFGVAVPFFDPAGTVLGAVSAIGPAVRGDDKKHSELCIKATQEAAQYITNALAGSNSPVY